MVYLIYYGGGTMAKSQQAKWAQSEMFLLLAGFMDEKQSEEDVMKCLKKLNGWMIFGKDDTLLSVYLFACQKRLPLLSKPNQQLAAKSILECAKAYRYSKEYTDLLQFAKKLIEK